VNQPSNGKVDWHSFATFSRVIIAASILTVLITVLILVRTVDRLTRELDECHATCVPHE
jgi:hypothetical protein